MTRYNTQKSRHHSCAYIGWGTYRMSWTVDRYIKGSRLRYPTQYQRDTDEPGARRFCRRWDIECPKEEGDMDVQVGGLELDDTPPQWWLDDPVPGWDSWTEYAVAWQEQYDRYYAIFKNSPPCPLCGDKRYYITKQPPYEDVICMACERVRSDLWHDKERGVIDTRKEEGDD